MRELIFRRGTPPDAEYTFKHALVQDAAYSTLLRSSSPAVARPHRRDPGKPISQKLLPTQPELLAQHCTEAGFDEKAIELLAQGGATGDRAVRNDRSGGPAPQGA